MTKYYFIKKANRKTLRRNLTRFVGEVLLTIILFFSITVFVFYIYSCNGE